jgi:acetolactate synthase-1/2/3 large subunit
MIHSPNEIISVLDEAIKLAVSGRQGPVWIDIPLDVQSGQINNAVVDLSPILTEKIKAKPEEINDVAEVLNAAKRPVILIGSGVRHSRGIESLITLAKNSSIPVVYTSSSADIYGSKNYGSIGSVGTMGCSRAGNIVTHSADALLILGNRLTSMTTGPNPEDFAPNAIKIFVDVDSEEAKKNNLSINKVVVCDSKYFIDQLNDKIVYNLHSKWLKKCESVKIEFNQLENDFKSDERIDLYDLTYNLSQHIPNEINIVTDSGLCELIIPTNINLEKKQRLIHPTSQGSMGFAIPGAIGAYLASRSPTLVIVGDGSIMMNLQELESIKYNKYTNTTKCRFTTKWKF